ncbi:MAG: HU family DNA-binding protein [Nitrospirae bacterium]|nr:HU family DNA-binding protein [Nitrospirota bacterium]
MTQKYFRPRLRLCFGTFSVRERKARQGRNHQTGAQIDMPAKKVVKFNPIKSLKEAVEG